jgi:hypothetical protein
MSDAPPSSPKRPTPPKRKPHKSKKLPGGEPVEPIDGTYIRQRWISRPKREWAEDCAEIMRSHGAVAGARIYRNRKLAEYHAQALERLIVELRIMEKWQMRMHTHRRGDGWAWEVEYLGRDGEGKDQ